MTRTGRTLTEFLEMRAGLSALLSFIRYLPADSALYQETHPEDEFGEWNERRKTNAILADIFDVVVKAHTKKGSKAFTYPRPKEKKRVGRGAVTIPEFWEWWNKER